MTCSRLVLVTLATLAALVPVAWANESNEALWEAARKGEVAAVKAALDQGADANAKTKYGATALSFACDKGHVEVVKLLLEKGADPNAKDTFYQSTPLVWAAMHKHAEVVRALLEKGAEGADDVLPMAVSEGDVATVKAVIAGGKASPQAMSASLAVAKTAANSEIVDLLKQAGASEATTQPTVEVSPSVLASYAGTYKSTQIGMEIVMTPKEGKLMGAVTGQPSLTYAPTSETAFEAVEFPGIKISFNVANGKVPSLTVEQGGGKFQFDRVADKPADAAASQPTASAPAPADLEDTAKVEAPMNWPSFRGPAASGVADGQHPPVTWDAPKSTNVAWKTEIPGLAHSSPVLWGDRVFVTTAIDSNPESTFRHGLYGDVDSVKNDSKHTWRIYGLDKKTGKIVWDKTAHEGLARIKRHMKSGHSDSTPATDGKHVVAMMGSEGLFCYSVDGDLLWKKDLGVLDAGWFYDPDYQWGFGSSPIIYRDAVIVQCDVQKGSFLAAFDLKDGKEVWRTPREEVPSWGTPTVYEGKDRVELLTNGTQFVRGYDPSSGKELWRLGRNSEITVPTPIVAHGLIFVTSGYTPIQPIYAIRLGASGDITLADDAETSDQVAWSKKRGGPYMPTPVAYGDHLYTCANQGVLTCYNAKSGEQVYRTRIADGKGGGYTASPVVADGRLYFTSEDGDIFVVKAGPKYELLATNPMGEVCMATPAISDGTFFVRTQHHVFGLRRKE